MDFVLIFLLGYCSRDIFDYIKSIVNESSFDKEFKNIIDLDAEWNSDDLP